MQLTRPDLGTGFVGFPHFGTMLGDEIFWIALRNTVLRVVLAIGIELILGLISALALNQGLRITLPMLKMVLAATVCLRVIGLVSSPDLLLILTGGGPGHSTEVLALYAFNTAYRAFDFGHAGALSVVMLGLQMALCYAYVRFSGLLRTI